MTRSRLAVLVARGITGGQQFVQKRGLAGPFRTTTAQSAAEAAGALGRSLTQGQTPCLDRAGRAQIAALAANLSSRYLRFSMSVSLAFPTIDPVLITIGPFPVRWYAMAYIAGLALGWAYARSLVRRKDLWGGAEAPVPGDIDDLLLYVAMGVIFGGRLGYVLFYNASFYLAHPAEVFALWNGGMSFHGGLAGTILAIYL
ncbi:MAG: prolipoprotein diacylglyceryl transferase, partial [Beijerinckiaceae bacterium]|nr:prolipoprotein diacylglyceryl transferase [Beijerinckiaceae bacterium]